MLNTLKAGLLALTFVMLPMAAHADEQADQRAIADQARAMSEAIIAGNTEAIVNLYTKDAVIVPGGRAPMAGDDLRAWWTPRPGVKTTHHKTTPLEVHIEGNMASDYGAYEGGGVRADGTEFSFKGVYTIIWRRGSDGVWRMYVDMWHPVKD
ncbi:MAG: DUF4440 domain-containing protein [Alphaproteobacteria bacterium]|nr:MAG: DUF4440 domain-containing protein [Alphaproteobacteria bacterium]